MPVSTNAQCGAISAGVVSTCPTGQSCSKWGWCGYSDAYSGEGCQPEYGICSAVPSGSAVGSYSSAASTGVSETTPLPLPSTWTTITITTSASQAMATTTLTPVAISVSSSAAFSSSGTSSYATPSPPAYSSSTSASAYSPQPSSPSGAVPYTVYAGTGETSEGWPQQEQWLPYDSLFSANMNIMRTSCAQWSVPNNSEDEIANLKSAISSVAQASSVDERFILAIVLQESNGCVRAPTTAYSVTNPGLMQSFNGKAQCNCGPANAPEQVQNPCPMSEIHDMIEEGTDGTGPGSMSLVYALQTAACQDVSRYYKAARIYNSGSIASSGLLQDGVATHCYASDIANRLLGWNGQAPSTCEFNSVA